MKPRVVVVGSFVQDLMFRCAAFPQAGETVVGQFITGPGGKGSNQAIACGRTGVPTLYVGAIGEDAFGREAEAYYRAAGIPAAFARKKRAATGTAAILVNTAGQNEIVVALGANEALQRRDLPLAALRSADVVVCQCESNLDTTAHALRTARRAGAITILNPAPMRPDFDLGLLRDVAVLIPNETEFASLLTRLPGAGAGAPGADELQRLDPAELHARCRQVGVPTVIVTLGSRGCLVSEESGHTFLPAHRGLTVVDTTGAGDAFVGGFAAGLVKHRGDRVKAARLGNAVAALSVTRPGTAPAMPTRRELAAFLRRAAPAVRRRSGARRS
jgi:ribokinase